VKRLSRGDRIVFYGKKHFLATATIDSDAYKVPPERDYWLKNRFHHTQGIDLLQSDIWDHKLPIDCVLDKLGFVVHKDMWQIHMQGGVRELTRTDFDTIIDAHNRPVEHSELLLIKKLSSSEVVGGYVRLPDTVWHKLDKRDSLTVLVKGHVVDMRIDLGRMFPISIFWNEFKSMAGFDEKKDYIAVKRRENQQIEIVFIPTSPHAL